MTDMILPADQVDWEQCHHCSSHALEGGFVEIISRYAYQEMQCLTCDREWVDVYSAWRREEKS